MTGVTASALIGYLYRQRLAANPSAIPFDTLIEMREFFACEAQYAAKTTGSVRPTAASEKISARQAEEIVLAEIERREAQAKRLLR